MKLSFTCLEHLFAVTVNYRCCLYSVVVSLTGHGDSDIGRCSGRGLRVGGAEWLQADGWLVVVTKGRTLAARCLTGTETIHIQHNAVHTGNTGLRTDRGSHSQV